MAERRKGERIALAVDKNEATAQPRVGEYVRILGKVSGSDPDIPEGGLLAVVVEIVDPISGRKTIGFREAAKLGSSATPLDGYEWVAAKVSGAKRKILI